MYFITQSLETQFFSHSVSQSVSQSDRQTVPVKHDQWKNKANLLQQTPHLVLYDFILDPRWVITVSSSGHLTSYTFDPYDVSINLLFPWRNNCPAASNDISRYKR